LYFIPIIQVVAIALVVVYLNIQLINYPKVKLVGRADEYSLLWKRHISKYGSGLIIYLISA